jgi:hypothetical protein
MTDEEIVFKYLNRNFRITEYNPKTNSFEVGAIHGSKVNNVEEELKIVFSETKYLDNIYYKWFMDSIDKINVAVNSFFNDCELILGNIEWEIHHTKYGRLMNKQDVYIRTYGLQHSESIINYFYQRWYNENIIRAYQKVMRNF